MLVGYARCSTKEQDPLGRFTCMWKTWTRPTSGAIQAGATAAREPSNQFYGDRSGAVTDPFGNTWGIATHVEDVPPDELKKRAEEFQKKFASN